MYNAGYTFKRITSNYLNDEARTMPSYKKPSRPMRRPPGTTTIASTINRRLINTTTNWETVVHHCQDSRESVPRMMCGFYSNQPIMKHLPSTSVPPYTIPPFRTSHHGTGLMNLYTSYIYARILPTLSAMATPYSAGRIVRSS